MVKREKSLADRLFRIPAFEFTIQAILQQVPNQRRITEEPVSLGREVEGYKRPLR